MESFNGKLRDELLNYELFLSLAEARYVLDQCRLDYNHRRLHNHPRFSHKDWHKNPEGLTTTNISPIRVLFTTVMIRKTRYGEYTNASKHK